jgi:hypothetical protein
MDSLFPRSERRRAPRLAISLAASLRERGRAAFSVELVDLSTLGCRVECSSDIEAGAWVWLKLPGLEPRYSRVAWCRGCFAGIEFEIPLHEAVVDCLVGMDYVPSGPELERLRRISERCRALAARTSGLPGDEAELLDLARYCEAGAAVPGAPGGPPS